MMWERAFVTFSGGDATVRMVRPWMYTVARNECIDAIRARRTTQPLDVTDVELAGGPTPEETSEQRAELRVLLGDLAELSARQRSALILREFAGLEGERLAGALGTSAPRAHGLVAEARRGLIERRSGRGLPCSTAQHELKRMRRRSTGVQAHLDSCADCQSFERIRRGRSLSSLAISPLLLFQGLAERLCLGGTAAPQALVKATAATALAAGTIGLAGLSTDHADPRRAPAPVGTAQRSVASDSRSARPARAVAHHATAGAHAARGGARRPRLAGSRPVPATAATRPQAPVLPAATPQEASPAAASAPGDDPSTAVGRAPDSLAIDLKATATATLDGGLTTAEPVTSAVRDILGATAAVLTRALPPAR